MPKTLRRARGSPGQLKALGLLPTQGPALVLCVAPQASRCCSFPAAVLLPLVSDPLTRGSHSPSLSPTGGSWPLPGPGRWGPQWLTSSVTQAQATPYQLSPMWPQPPIHPDERVRVSRNTDLQEAHGQTEIHYEDLAVM